MVADFLFLNAGVFAQEPVPPFDKEAFIESVKQPKVLRLGLVDCIAYALKNNSEIKIKRIEPQIKQDDVKIAQSEFEPTFSADFNIEDITSQSAKSTLFGPAVSTSRTTSFNTGVSGKFITGTEYQLDFLNHKYKSNTLSQEINPYYTSEPKITITQPLFRDFGILVNKADITIASNNKEISWKNFQQTVMDVISRSKSAYYSYLYFLQSYSIAGLSLERANDLFQINKARYDKGLISSVELLETEAAVAQRKRALISAEGDLKTAEDELKLITNLIDDPQLWNADLELISQPVYEAEKVDLVESLHNAFQYRPDYRAAEMDLRSRDIRIKTALNQLYPEVDVIGSLGVNGLGSDYQRALDSMDADFKDWGIGVKFSVPWGTGERAKYDQSKLEKAQAIITFKRLEQNIILEVRKRVRQVEIYHRQIEVAKILKETETRHYEAQKERYAAGQVSIHDMLDYQESLAEAELVYVKALIDHNVALITLTQSEGLTLVKNDIKLEE